MNAHVTYVMEVLTKEVSEFMNHVLQREVSEFSSCEQTEYICDDEERVGATPCIYLLVLASHQEPKIIQVTEHI